MYNFKIFIYLLYEFDLCIDCILYKAHDLLIVANPLKNIPYMTPYNWLDSWDTTELVELALKLSKWSACTIEPISAYILVTFPILIGCDSLWSPILSA